MRPNVASLCFFCGVVLTKRVSTSAGAERCRVRLRLFGEPRAYVEIAAYGDEAKELDLCAVRGGSIYAECVVTNIPHLTGERKWVELEFKCDKARAITRPRTSFKKPNPKKVADILAAYDPSTYLE